jgi:hypothetical protein
MTCCSEYGKQKVQQCWRDVCVAVSMGSRRYSKNLVSVERTSTFWSFVESFLEEVGACENLLSSQPLPAAGCPKCQQHRRHSSSAITHTSGSHSEWHRLSVIQKLHLNICRLSLCEESRAQQMSRPQINGSLVHTSGSHSKLDRLSIN